MSDRVGQEILTQHPYAYRSGQWALITGTTLIAVGKKLRECYLLRWPDGVTDEYAIEDPTAEYEFRTPGVAA